MQSSDPISLHLLQEGEPRLALHQPEVRTEGPLHPGPHRHVGDRDRKYDPGEENQNISEESDINTNQALSVIGGTEAERNSLPWQAALGERENSGTTEWFCGGSFIGQ